MLIPTPRAGLGGVAAAWPAFLLLALPLAAQSLLGEIRFQDFDPANRPDYQFGAAMDPDGVHAYVAISGNYGGSLQNNRRLVKVQVHEQRIVAETLVGWFPEDIAVVTDAAGGLRHLLVTSSVSNDLRILDPALQTVATVPFGPCPPFASQFPFGVAASPDGRLAVVTTLAGCGLLFVVDIDPVSATFATVVRTPNVPGGHGRPVFVGTQVVVPTALYGPAAAYSRGGMALVDPGPQGGVQHVTQLTPVLGGTYVAGLDAARLPNGAVLMTMNGDPAQQLYEIDPLSGAILRTIPLGATAGLSVHGLDVSPNGRLAVVTSQDTGAVLFVDLAAGLVLASLDGGATAQPNEAVFTRDGSTVLVTRQTAASARLFGGLPLRDPSLASPTLPAPGAVCALTVAEGDAGQPVAILVSAGVVPSSTAGLPPLVLAPPYAVLGSGSCDAVGRFTLGFVMPAVLPQYSGTPIHLQALLLRRTGHHAASLPVTAILP